MNNTILKITNIAGAVVILILMGYMTVVMAGYVIAFGLTAKVIVLIAVYLFLILLTVNLYCLIFDVIFQDREESKEQSLRKQNKELIKENSKLRGTLQTLNEDAISLYIQLKKAEYENSKYNA